MNDENYADTVMTNINITYSDNVSTFPAQNTYSDWTVPTLKTGRFTTTLVDGNYEVWASDIAEWDLGETRAPAKMFENPKSDANGGELWVVESGYDATTGNSIKSEGEFVAIALPTLIQVSKYTMKTRDSNFEQMPSEWYLEGSNDEVTWEQIDYQTHTSNPWSSAWQENTYELSNTTSNYNKYRWRFTKTNNSAHLAIFGLKLFGKTVTDTIIPSTAIPKVLDLNNTIHDSIAVNYAHVYLYGTDGTVAHDDIDMKTVIGTESVYGVVAQAIDTNNTSAFSSSSLGDVVISPNNHLTWMLRFKTPSSVSTTGTNNRIYKLLPRQYGTYV